MLTAKQVALLLGLKPRTVYELADRGMLPPGLRLFGRIPPHTHPARSSLRWLLALEPSQNPVTDDSPPLTTAPTTMLCTSMENGPVSTRQVVQ